jgi:hypothetical protein
MIKKTWAGLLCLVAFGFASAADWRTELLSYLSPRPDYQKALHFLVEKIATIDGAERQTADALISFIASKAGDRTEEENRISDYFEKYHDNDPDFSFLDDLTRREFLVFWAHWKTTYPLVTGVRFLSYPRGGDSDIPAGIRIGFDLLNNAYYKITLGSRVLEGGLWGRGFHIIDFPAENIFDRSATYTLVLDLKAGDTVVRKPIPIKVTVSDVGTVRSPAPSLPPIADGSKKAATLPPLSTLEGEISLYVDGKLILTSRKVPSAPPPLNIPLAGPLMQGTKPYMPPPTTDPIANSVSIIDAIAMTYKTLKDLFAKKPPAPSPPPYREVTSLSFSYERVEEDGALVDAKAEVLLDQERGTVFRR